MGELACTSREDRSRIVSEHRQRSETLGSSHAVVSNAKCFSLSPELLDQLVTDARKQGRIGPSRSVISTIDIDTTDPLLDRADEALQALFEGSLGRPLAVAEGWTPRARSRPTRRRG